MEINIKLSADQVDALEGFLSTQVDQVVNPISGNVSMRPKYATVQDFILFQTGIYVGNAMQMFPPAGAQADMLAIKDAQERIAKLSKPVLVLPTIGPPAK